MPLNRANSPSDASKIFSNTKNNDPYAKLCISPVNIKADPAIPEANIQIVT